MTSFAYLAVMAPSVAEERDDSNKDSAYKNHENNQKNDGIDPRWKAQLQNSNFRTWEWDTAVTYIL